MPDEVTPVEPAAEVAAPEPVAPAPTAPANDAPWSKDLATLFTDEGVRGQVDEYMRTTVQPRMTKLEQEYAPARAIYEDLTADPETAFMNLADGLWGEENPDRVKAFAEALGFEVEDTAPAGETPAEAHQYAQLSPEDRETLDAWKADQAAKQEENVYEQYKAAVAAATEGRDDLDEATLAPFIVSNDGDIDAAIAAYDSYYSAQEAAFRAKYGVEAPPAPVAPATIGADGAGGVSTPPVARKYASIDDAITETLAEDRVARQGAITAVGQV